MSFKDNLKKVMEKAMGGSDSYHTNDLASKLGLSDTTVAGWVGRGRKGEIHYPKADVIERICEVLNCGVEDLFDEKYHRSSITK